MRGPLCIKIVFSPQCTGTLSGRLTLLNLVGPLFDEPLFIAGTQKNTIKKSAMNQEFIEGYETRSVSYQGIVV